MEDKKIIKLFASYFSGTVENCAEKFPLSLLSSNQAHCQNTLQSNKAGIVIFDCWNDRLEKFEEDK